jgi:hypothetical protein
MAHAGDVEMAFALAIQILLAQIPVPALEQDREKAQLIFFADSGHVGSEDGLSKRANTQLSRNPRQLFDSPTQGAAGVYTAVVFSYCSDGALSP